MVPVQDQRRANVGPGTKLGPYEVISSLGAGGMGEVYRARDTRLGRSVAIKVLPQQLSQMPDLQRRLNREARAIAKLSHPNICALHDIGHHEGTDFLVVRTGPFIPDFAPRRVIPIFPSVSDIPSAR
jgi:serine/threonine protein kinase